MGGDEVFVEMQKQVTSQAIRITDHAREEMEAEAITLSEVREAIATGQIIENYPDHRRGACCLVFGMTAQGRPLHIICTTSLPLLVLITVYVPTLPKWVHPTKRRLT